MIASIPLSATFTRLSAHAQEPFCANFSDVGWDLFTLEVKDCGEFLKIHTGIAVEPPLGYYFMLVPRSSAHKQGLTLYNNVGIIDPSYRGEIIALMLKTLTYQTPPAVGTRLVQLIPVVQPILEWKEGELEETARACGGFGSSGE